METFNGSVDISGWDQDTVDISGTKYGPSQEEADNLRVDVDASPDSVSVHVPRPTDRRNNQGARLTIKIPRNTQLDRITTSNSSIHTAGWRRARAPAHQQRLHSRGGPARRPGSRDLQQLD